MMHPRAEHSAANFHFFVQIITDDVADFFQVVGVEVVDAAVIIVLEAGYLYGHRYCPSARSDYVYG